MTGRGKSAASLILIEASRRILSEIQPASVRAVCYRLFIEGLIPSMVKSNTSKVGVQLVYARECGIIPWAWILSLPTSPTFLITVFPGEHPLL